MALHPRERKKTIEANIAKNNSAKILAKIFDFDPQEYLDKFLLFDLKKTSEEQIFEAILEKIPDDDKYHIEHRDGRNSFRIRRDEKQGKKDNIIKATEDIDNKIKKTTNKSRLSQFKRIRKELLNRCSELGETFVDIHDKINEVLDELLDVERKLVSGELKRGELTSLRRKRNELKRKYKSLGGNYD